MKPLHVGVILDGNGRWAQRRGLPRSAGHRAGVEAVRRVVRAAQEHGVGTLTLYAFSAQNWRRPETETRGLMRLFHEYLAGEAPRLRDVGVRLTGLGRRDRIGAAAAAALEAAESATRGGDRLHLRVAVDYSSRDEILRAAGQAPRDEDLSRERFSRLLASGEDPGDVDLVIRTSGERRLSDFLLWECAYAELYFTETLWPDFTEADFGAAIADFTSRRRTFGGLAAAS